MAARIYRPARNAMQSGKGNTDDWILEYIETVPRTIEPLMGWTSSADMNSQVRLNFGTKEAAIEYAEKNAIPYVVEEPKRRQLNVRTRGYGGNFAHDRRTTWTH